MVLLGIGVACAPVGTPGERLMASQPSRFLYRAFTADNEVGAGLTMFAQEDRPRCRPGAIDESGSGNVPQLSISATATAWNGGNHVEGALVGRRPAGDETCIARHEHARG